MASSKPPNCLDCGSELRPWGGCPRCTLAAMMSSDDDSEDIGKESVFGDYEMLEEIARGGAGVVWRARQRRLGRVVALKILRESALPGEEAARRFRFECETVARLRHPHIVTVHEIGESGGRWFMSMDFMEGGTLAGRMKRDPLPPRDAARLLVKVARAVQHAHGHGVIHRDLKPGNILIDAAGEPHVGDFGLARDADDIQDITITGVVLGTPSYMSPEQAAGVSRGLTTATDVYALGAILYEMLTCKPVFHGQSHIDVLRKTREEEAVSPAKLVPGLNRDIATICLKCLEKNPDARYAGAGALADDLDRWLRGEPVIARTSSAPERLWKWTRRHPAKAALAATIVAALVSVSIISTVFSVKVERERVATLHRVSQQHTQRALHFMENGDSFRGLLSLSEALDIGSGDANAERMDRIRFATIMRMSPRLVGLWILPKDTPLRAQFPTAGHIVLLTHGNTARLGDGPALKHSSAVIGADVNNDGTRVVCGTADGRWTLWDTRKAVKIATGEGGIRAFPALSACHPDGTIAVDRFVVVDGNIVRQFRTSDGSPAAPEMTHELPVLWAAISPDARKLFTLAEDGLLLTASADEPDSRSRPVRFGSDLQFHSISKAVEQGFVTVCDSSGAHFGLVGWQYAHPLTIYSTHAPMWFPVPGPLLAIGWSGKGQSHFLTGGKLGATLRNPWVYVEPQSYQLGTTFPQGTRTIAGTFDRAGRIAATLSVNGATQIWDVPSEGRMGPRLWAVGKPFDVRLSADGTEVLIRTSAAAVWHWKWPADDGADRSFSAAEWAAAPESANFPVTVAQVHHHNAATIVDGQAVAITDAVTGEAVTPPIIHSEPVNTVSLSPDGRLLCTAWGGSYARVWETASGQPVTPQFRHADVTSIAWHRSGASLITIGKSGDIRLWDLAPAKHSVAELKTLAQVLSAHRILPGSESGIIPLSAQELTAAWESTSSERVGK